MPPAAVFLHRPVILGATKLIAQFFGPALSKKMPRYNGHNNQPKHSRDGAYDHA
jgi:hypothetical protein